MTFRKKTIGQTIVQQSRQRKQIYKKMKIFISHSLADHEIISGVKDTLEPHGVTLFIAEHYQDLERTITEKIENMIRQCDVALILLTRNGYNSHFVQQEIGYIKSQNKPYLQVIQLGYEKKIKGFNYGKGYVPFDPTQPHIALEKVKRSLLTYWQKKNEKQRQRTLARQQELAGQQRMQLLRQLEEQRKKDETVAKFAIGGLATLVILGLLGGSGK
ncbi:MAG: toll/interleukin-1 receptor domain-containing protein [Candidatus Brocadiaceae bacterium]|uniref:toll/interleukin-1 receptor domain-containing protein n=1 Tax=Candidatus Wunengus sp. YC61 TaxID=3367698 RepID=UPI00271A7256|nr:toll/interleukin-1 receptor domain-containing protein [Candidatus Brocadiaceae bacterium]